MDSVMLLFSHTRCLKTATAGALLGLAASAFAQDVVSHAPVQVGATIDPSMQMMIHLLQAGGLPAVLGGFGWMLGRGGGIPVTIQLHADDRDLLRRLTKRLAYAVEDPTNPNISRKDLDDSVDR